MPMSCVNTAKGSRVTKIALNGVIGLSDASALHKTLKQSVQQGCAAVVIDLAEVVDIDNACWSRLVTAARGLRRQGGCVVLRHCPERLFHQLQTCRWDRCFLLPEHRPQDLDSLTGDVMESIE